MKNIIEPDIADTLRSFLDKLARLKPLTDGSHYMADFSRIDSGMGIVTFDNNKTTIRNVYNAYQEELKEYAPKRKELTEKYFNQKLLKILESPEHIPDSTLLKLMYTVSNFVGYESRKLHDNVREAFIKRLSIEGYDDLHLERFYKDVPTYPITETKLPSDVIAENKAIPYLLENFMHQLKNNKIQVDNEKYITEYGELLFGKGNKYEASSYESTFRKETKELVEEDIKKLKQDKENGRKDKKQEDKKQETEKQEAGKSETSTTTKSYNQLIGKSVKDTSSDRVKDFDKWLDQLIKEFREREK